MSMLLASAALATAMLPNCSWNHPGRNPYRGTVSEAVSRYVDIPATVRTALIAKIESGRADDTAAIMRDSIAGKYDYSPQITEMHFGERTVCGTVTRDQWSDTTREPGKVYCVDNQCLIVPQICGNISRVQRVAGSGGGTAIGGGGGAAMPAAVAVSRPAEPGLVRAASPDDVAVADAMAGMVASEPETIMQASSAFASPFGSASYGASLNGRNPGAGTEPAPMSPVPEPATFGMLGAGLAMVAGLLRLRGRRNAAD